MGARLALCCVLLGLFLAAGAASAAKPQLLGAAVRNGMSSREQLQRSTNNRRLQRLLQGEQQAPASGSSAAKPSAPLERQQAPTAAAGASQAPTVIILDGTRGASSAGSTANNNRRQAGADTAQQQPPLMVLPIGAGSQLPQQQKQQQQQQPGSTATAVPVVTTQTRQVVPAAPGSAGGATETITSTSVLVAPPNAAQVLVPVPAGQGTVGQVVVVPGSQQPTPIVTLVPTKPMALPSQGGVEPLGPYCIPRTPAGLAVLGIGDSITQGSVPSKNLNHPYTIRAKEVLEAQLQLPVKATDAGLGGGGVFMTGFNVPTTFGPWMDSYMALGPWNVTIVMIGINDLLRGGRAADDIMAGLKPMLDKVLAAGTPVILMPPLAAPGFVQESDSKEAERKKLGRLFRAFCSERAASTRGMGPQAWFLDLQTAALFDFYAMPPADRAKWLDDGLHMTELAYDTIGELVAKEIMSHMCAESLPPVQSNSD